jgi:hypothetical protein
METLQFIAAYLAATAAALGIAWLLIRAVRGCVRYYRDNRPMATRVTRKPFDDDRSSQRNFKRIVTR